MASRMIARFCLASLSVATLCGIGAAGATGSDGGAASSRKGNLLKPARLAARADVASYALTRGAGRIHIVMRTADGREAFRTDEERALTVVMRGVEVPPLPEASTVKSPVSSLTTSPRARQSNPVGCERALSGLVRASALSESRCVT